MKRVNVKFEAEAGRQNIDVLFKASEKDRQVSSLMERIADPLAGNFTVRDSENATVSLSENSIITVGADNKRLRIVAENGTYWLKMSVQDIERLLNPNRFLRISRYEIINLQKVKQFDFSVSGTLRIELENSIETWASRRFIPPIKKRLQERS